MNLEEFHRLPGGSTLARLEVFYVMSRLKPSAILFLDQTQYNTIHEWKNRYGLTVSMSRYKLHSEQVATKNGFSNKAQRIDISSPLGSYVIAVSKDRLTSDLAVSFYDRGDDKNLAAVLGYPICCAEFYVRCLPVAARKDMDFVMLADRKRQSYSFVMNRMLRYFDLALLSHFPCSYECDNSLEQGLKRMDLIRSELSPIALRFETQLRSLVIYTEDHGIFYAPEYQAQGDEFTFSDIYGSIDSGLKNELVKTRRIKVLEDSSFCVGDTSYTKDAAAMLFV